MTSTTDAASIAALTKRAHDLGFEKGSHLTLQTVMTYLDAIGRTDVADLISEASVAGELERYRPDLIVAPDATPVPAVDAPAKPVPVLPTDIAPPKLTHEQAKTSGFTGNQCNECGSMQMVRNGACEKCQSCGATTGCS